MCSIHHSKYSCVSLPRPESNAAPRSHAYKRVCLCMWWRGAEKFSFSQKHGKKVHFYFVSRMCIGGGYIVILRLLTHNTHARTHTHTGHTAETAREWWPGGAMVRVRATTKTLSSNNIHTVIQIHLWSRRIDRSFVGVDPFSYRYIVFSLFKSRPRARSGQLKGYKPYARFVSEW